MPSISRQSEPRTRRNTNARPAILRCAARLFAKKGFTATTMREIARAAKIQAPSILYHFPTKLAVLYAIMEQTSQGMVDRQRAALDAAGDPLQALRSLIRIELRAFSSAESDLYPEVLVHEWRSLKPRQQQTLLALRREYETNWVAVLEQCYQARLIAARPDVVRRVLNGAFAWVPNWFQEDRELSEEALAREIFIMLVGPTPQWSDDVP